MKKPFNKKKPSSESSIEMRAEYDFSGGVRGKYAGRYREGTNVVLLDPALTQAFPDSKSVNDALRALLAVATRVDRRKRARSQPLISPTPTLPAPGKIPR